MNLGKVHLVGSLLMTACAVAYTVWSLSGGSSPSTAQAIDAPVASAVSGNTAVSVDPTQLPPPADVALDRLPQWARNPFAPRRPPAMPEVVETAAPIVEPPPDVELVVGAILYSATRRVAVVNGKRVSVGDRIDGATVVDILPDAVVVESPAYGRRTVVRRRAGAR